MLAPWEQQYAGGPRELAVERRFIHPELKLLGVGPSAPVVPTYTASLAFVRIPLCILHRVVAARPPLELVLECSSPRFLSPDHTLHLDLPVLQF